MMDITALAEISMLNDQQRMNVISNNIANSSTTGYRKTSVVQHSFVNFLDVNLANAQGSKDAVAVAVPDHKLSVDKSIGLLKRTGNPLDLAIEDKNSFFALQTPQGVLYSRKGNFRISANGILVSSDGHPVLGQSGQIQLSGSNPVIDKSGQIKDGDRNVGSILTVQLSSDAMLRAVGNGMYALTSGRSVNNEKTVAVRQGYLETSNVNMMNEMVAMMQTMRHFEATQQLLRGYDSVLGQAISSLGEF